MAKDPRSGLLALPCEIRDEILYHLMYPDGDTIVVSNWESFRSASATKGLALQMLSVNKQLNAEATFMFQRILSSVPRFVLDLDMTRALEFLTSLSPEFLGSIRSLWIPYVLVASMIVGDLSRFFSKDRDYGALFSFVRWRMQLNCISVCVDKLWPGLPGTDIIFLLGKLLYDDVVKSVRLYSAFLRHPDEGRYGDQLVYLSLAADHADSWSPLNGDLPLFSLIPGHSYSLRQLSQPFVMIEERRDSTDYMDLNVPLVGLPHTIQDREKIHSYYNKMTTTKIPFCYPLACRKVDLYRKNPEFLKEGSAEVGTSPSKN